MKLFHFGPSVAFASHLIPPPFPVFDFMMSCGCNLCISSRSSPAFYTAKTTSIKGTNMKMRIKLHQLALKNYKPGKCRWDEESCLYRSTTAHVYLGSRPLSSPSLRSYGCWSRVTLNNRNKKHAREPLRSPGPFFSPYHAYYNLPPAAALFPTVSACLYKALQLLDSVMPSFGECDQYSSRMNMRQHGHPKCLWSQDAYTMT